MIPTAPTPNPTWPQEIEPGGSLNTQYDLGSITKREQRDLTGDGINEQIFTFANGKVVVLVSNYGEEKPTGEARTEYKTETVPDGTERKIVRYESKEVLIKCGGWRTETSQPDDCPEKQAAAEIARDNAAQALEPGVKMKASAIINAGKQAAAKTPCPPVTTRIYDEPVYETRSEPVYETVAKTNTVTTPKQVPVTKPMADWGDVNADGNRHEQVIATIDLGNDYESPERKLVLQTLPPAPPPAPKPKKKDPPLQSGKQ
jgi:hypothetical protein